MRVNNDYVAGDTVIKHVDELLMLMSAMIKYDRYRLVRPQIPLSSCCSIYLIWKLNSHVTDRINNNFIKKGIKSYLIRDIIFYIQLCYNKHTKLKEVAL